MSKLIRESEPTPGHRYPAVLPQHAKKDGNMAVTGEVNPLPVNIINVFSSDALIFGAYWDKKSPSALIRTDAAVDLVAEAGVDGRLVQNNFDTMPIWGEFEDYVDDYGNEFRKIPKHYVRIRNGKDFLLKQVSKKKYPGFMLPWCFWDFENNKELDYVLVGKYEGSLSEDGKLESKPDKHPHVLQNIVQFRNLAQANNVDDHKGYQQHDVHVQSVLETLIEIEFATIHSQSIMQGFTTGRYTSSDVVTVAEQNANRAIVTNSTANQYRVGQSVAIGTAHSNNSVSTTPRVITGIDAYDGENTAIYFDGPSININVGHVIANRTYVTGFSKDILASSGSIGSNTDGKYPCMYRGIENPWGGIYKFVDGININNHQGWVCKNADQYASNVFATPYEQLAYTNAVADGYVTDMGFDPDYIFAMFPVEVGGGSSTFYADNYYQMTGQRIARVGGNWAYGAYAGLRLWYLAYSSSNTFVTMGGRLLKKAS